MTTTTKARPLLFSAPMVRALLAGRKTQTRRVVKPQPYIANEIDGTRYWNASGSVGGVIKLHPDFVACCPYGKPGDLLWVRETWARNENQTSDTHIDTSLMYRADGEERALDNGSEKAWSPSIFMPRKYSRMTLRITDVRVQRLQEINEADAIAEGITGPHDVGYQAYQFPGDSKPRYSRAAAAYEDLWGSINGADSWVANPWVWCISFDVIPNNVTEILTNGREQQ